MVRVGISCLVLAWCATDSACVRSHCWSSRRLGGWLRALCFTVEEMAFEILEMD